MADSQVSDMNLVDDSLVQPSQTMVSPREYSPSASPVDAMVSPDEHEPTVLVADAPPKLKGRQRLLRGISRISSTSSLVQFGRARSASMPYARSGATMSCISLSLSPSPSPGVPSLSSANSSGFVFSPMASPVVGPSSTSEFPYSALGSSSTPALSRLPAHAVPAMALARVSSAPLAVRRPKRTFAALWASLPYELQVHILGLLRPKELVRISRVSRAFYKLCFDGQLWSSFDASEFYQDIPGRSLSKIIAKAGPFVKDLNLRGCIQIEADQEAWTLSKSCQNLVTATLEGSHFGFHNLDTLLQGNTRLVNLNLTGLLSVNGDTCQTIARHCRQLEVLNLSWCKNVTAQEVQPVLEACRNVRDLRVSGMRGFDDVGVALTLFKTNRLERLVLAGCVSLTDAALSTMMHGVDPEVDLVTNRPLVPPRRLRHLDMSGCRRLTDRGVATLGPCVPHLEGLSLSCCAALTDGGLRPVLASTPQLAYLDLEDVVEVTNGLLADHVAKAPCAERLTYLSVSYCEGVGDAGVLPVLRACKTLKSFDVDNTQVSDLMLAEAASVVRMRARRTHDRRSRPYIGLSLAVYDCPNITWTGVREVLSRNAEILRPHAADAGVLPSYPSEVISLKCFYGWQMTVDEHTKRVLRGNFAAAARLERKWGDYMRASEEAEVAGAGGRRRRRRAREARQVHAHEQTAGVVEENQADGSAPGEPTGIGRRRARTATCIVM